MIKEVVEHPETGEIVHCSLEFDKKTITFKFGLNADSPQDITSKLVRANLQNLLILCSYSFSS